MQMTNRQLAGITAALVLLMAATRYNHFGSAVALPDASLAIFLLGGFYLGRVRHWALATFAGLLLLAGTVDYYATVLRGVSDWCMTPAYWFLIPTYAVLWFGGRWLATHLHYDLAGAVRLAGTVWGALTLAFLLSNGSFYLLSGYFPEMGLAAYAAAVAKYYPSYLGSALLYLIPASLAHWALLRRSEGPSVHA